MFTPKLKNLHPPSPDAGFTLIESVVAIVLLSVMLVGVAPVIVLSTATRVQARRVEMATQAARAYVDGVRSGVIFPPYMVVELDETTEKTVSGETIQEFDSQRDAVFSAVLPPAGNALGTCVEPGTKPKTLKPENYPYCNNPKEPKAAPTSGAGASSSDVSLYCLDLDLDGKCTGSSHGDLIVQAYRSSGVQDSKALTAAELKGTIKQKNGISEDESMRQGYILGLRVYRADAFDGSGNLKAGTAQRSYGATWDKKAPLVEMTTEIKGTGEATFDSLCGRLGGTCS
ncbi:hormogonium polysaccharide secretion pseudopilin HpsB [Roseofilum casamattae]|uniref:Hormogonium polysaccharide secretion pseudopilin HpsB n=1 Tax=Roseofilum casamattae BLCC-M143 TaxID=3022442 RepID=A0ABT7C100_9CYAN|nr:hormogonium polysaccharide secretion pseudopilin HpsB [Roseofilum casamattae]MDJ1184985.1 hormogonium polysaccharide secretion pseudopilin HpsB [Roseofilum casamattae BLCC-M143]